MRIIDAISMADAVKPNAFDEATKIRWLSEVEGMIQADIWLLAPEEWIEYDETTPTDTQLLVTGGHSKIYRAYLCAMIDLANGEYDHYATTSAVVNDYLQEYELWYTRVYHPADTWREVWKGHYFTAYGLAVKHGYAGTEAEWLASLRGPQGEPFRYEDFTAEQLAALVGPQGPKGEKGDRGPQGPQGEKGLDATVDASLTIEGAAADAAAVGKRILSLEEVAPKDTTLVLRDETVFFSYDGVVYYGNFATAFKPASSETYTVVIDGVSYTATAGNDSLSVGGYYFSSGGINGVDEGTHQIKITRQAFLLPDEHFPENVAKAEGEFELIEEITVSETGIGTITHVLADACKALMIIISTAGATVDSSFAIYASTTHTSYEYWPVQGLGVDLGASSFGKLVFRPLYGTWDIFAYQGWLDTTSTAKGPVGKDKVSTLLESPNIKRWRVYTFKSGGFPVGMTFKIYGVKEGAL